ncbi:hypothetical protein [Salinimonas chungwhensis]|uniref:hypothetical protein n=1 Tax=Salinimonas chungwhensis TaxID=265425 RepID=UPI00035EDE60|nr:hypothetical protein [Salinimonas chungwhensis]
MQKWSLEIHSGITLITIMVSLLLFVFEYIAKPQIIVAASILFVAVEVGLYLNSVIKKSARKRIAMH